MTKWEKPLLIDQSDKCLSKSLKALRPFVPTHCVWTVKRFILKIDQSARRRNESIKIDKFQRDFVYAVPIYDRVIQSSFASPNAWIAFYRRLRSVSASNALQPIRYLRTQFHYIVHAWSTNCRAVRSERIKAEYLIIAINRHTRAHSYSKEIEERTNWRAHLVCSCLYFVIFFVVYCFFSLVLQHFKISFRVLYVHREGESSFSACRVFVSFWQF